MEQSATFRFFIASASSIEAKIDTGKPLLDRR